MKLLLSLLLAVEWLVTVFALPRPEAVMVDAVVARTPVLFSLPALPTLAPQSWCQEVADGKGAVVWHTKTGSCTYNTYRGDVTRVGTDWVQLKPTDAGLVEGHQRPALPEQSSNSRGQSTGDGRCIFAKIKKKSANGKTFWSPDADVAQQTCNDYCANQLAADKAQGKIGSASCFKNDGKPWVNDKNQEPSGS